MLNHFAINVVSNDEINTMSDLFISCKAIKPTIEIILQDTENARNLGM